MFSSPADLVWQAVSSEKNERSAQIANFLCGFVEEISAINEYEFFVYD